MMWELYVILISLLAILLSTTLNLSLRVFSRSRLEEKFERLNMASAWEPFLAMRVEFALGAAVVRSAAVLALVLAVAIFWKHAANIRRLREGTEPRIGRKA